jgi:glycosyltransferase involved in cell wall biosynthesis
MRVGWFGYGGHSWMAEQLREPLKEVGIELVTCHEHPNADVPYSANKIFNFIDSCDAMYLPSRYKMEPAKSINRLALCWSRSKPCVVFPLPSYMKYAVNGENSLVVCSAEDAVSALTSLKNDTTLRNKIAKAGKQIADKFLSPISIISRFKSEISNLDMDIHKNLLEGIFLQIIIPHYSPKTSYLTGCLKSILSANLPPKVDVHVVSSSANNPQDTLLSQNLIGEIRPGINIRLTHKKERTSFSQANNFAIKHSANGATHFLFLNDDTLLGKNSVAGYFYALNGRNDIILNPYSNCDKGWLHNEDIVVSSEGQNISLYPGMEEAEVEKFIKPILDFKTEFTRHLHEAPFCAMYATLVPNFVLRQVGLLSTEYLNGGEDADYSYRAQKLGFKTYWTKSAFVFHYGGKSRKVSELEDKDRHVREDNHNNSVLFKKWPKKSSTKRLAIWTGPAWEKWGLDSYIKGGIGGSETCAARLAMVAAENGYHVTMIGEHDTHYDDKVTLIDWRSEDFEYELFDTVIASRSLNPIDWRLKSKKILVWIHDIWLLSGKDISNYHRQKVDKFIVLSPWHKNFVKQYHGLEENKLTIVPNGINTDLFEGIQAQKEWGRIHYSSSPDRGLDNVLTILPWVLDKCPDIKLNLFYGFYNWETAARARGSEPELQQIEALKNQIKSLGDRVVSHGRVSQAELAKEWAKAWCWLYPTTFCETFCITAKEAQLSATPILCSNVGALETTVGDFGIRVMSAPYSKEARQEYVDQLVKLYSDESYWSAWQEKASQGSSRISWGDVWTDYWSKLIV